MMGVGFALRRVLLFSGPGAVACFAYPNLQSHNVFSNEELRIWTVDFSRLWVSLPHISAMTIWGLRWCSL